MIDPDVVNLILNHENRIYKLEDKVAELERYTTGEDGYMIISVPVGSYVLPPKEERCVVENKWSSFINPSTLLHVKGTKSAEKMFTKEETMAFARYVLLSKTDYTEKSNERIDYEYYLNLWMKS